MSDEVSESGLICLHPDDNVLVSCRNLHAGELIKCGEQVLTIKEAVPIGHKVSRVSLMKGDKIIKYGASIGSAICDITIGCCIHNHNMKSDYIASHSRAGYMSDSGE